MSANPAVVIEGPNVSHELRQLGVSKEIIATIARKVAAGKAEALEIDPANAGGMLAYITGVRAVRSELLPMDWRISRTGNVEATVNDELGIQIWFQNVDLACTTHHPQAISGKGAGSRKLIQSGQIEMFESNVISALGCIGSTPKVWVVCVSIDSKRLRAEISCPMAFAGNQFAGFVKRIWVVDEEFNSEFINMVEENDGEDSSIEHEVRISKK